MKSSGKKKSGKVAKEATEQNLEITLVDMQYQVMEKYCLLMQLMNLSEPSIVDITNIQMLFNDNKKLSSTNHTWSFLYIHLASLSEPRHIPEENNLKKLLIQITKAILKNTECNWHIANNILIHTCLVKNNIQLLKILFETCKAQIINYDDTLENTLHIIATQPTTECSTYILSKLQQHSLNKNTPLIMGIYYNNYPLINWLIDHGCDINETSEKGVSPFMLALTKKQLNTVELLLKKNVRIASAKHNAESILGHMICDGKYESDIIICVLEQMISQGISLNGIVINGLSLVELAIRENLYELFIYLVRKNPTELIYSGFNLAVLAFLYDKPKFAEIFLGETSTLNIHMQFQYIGNLLHLCVEPSIIKWADTFNSITTLINEYGFDLNSLNEYGETPFLFAARMGNYLALSGILTELDQPINFKLVNNKGRHVGHYLIEHKHYSLVSNILSKEPMLLPMIDANGDTMLDLVLVKDTLPKLLLLEFLDIIQKQTIANRATFLCLKNLKQLPRLLHFFCAESILSETLKYVEDGQLPLHMAATYSTIDVVEDLVKTYKLNINQPNFDGETTLCFLIKQKKSVADIEQYILKFNPKTSGIDSINSTLLHIACEASYPELITWLFTQSKISFSILKSRKQNVSSLDIAISKQDLTIVTLLWNKLTSQQQDNYLSKTSPDNKSFLIQNALCPVPREILVKFLEADDLSSPQLQHPQLEVSIGEIEEPISLSKMGSLTPIMDSEHELKGLRQFDLSLDIDSLSPKLSSSATEWTGTPQCYLKNSKLRNLLHEISSLFEHSSCDGYLYGSSLYKVNPNDFDILIPNLRSIMEGDFQQLINSFLERGARITAFTDGRWGYSKADLHIIPIKWQGFNLEFVVYAQHYTTHALKLDFTIGARYFDLKKLITHNIPGINGLHDTHTKELNTIKDAYESFSEDWSRIFRGLRIIAAEKFKFSDACHQAIHRLFSGTSNIFADHPNPGKFKHQINLLIDSLYVEQHIQLLNYFNIMPKLIQYLQSLPDCNFFSSSYLVAALCRGQSVISPPSVVTKTMYSPRMFPMHSSPVFFEEEVSNHMKLY